MEITTFDVRNTFDDDGNLVMKSGIPAINEGLKTLIMTTRSELLGDPTFGSKLQELDKTNLSEILKDILQDDLREIIGIFDPRITISNIVIENDHIKAKSIINIEYLYESEKAWVSIHLLNKGD